MAGLTAAARAVELPIHLDGARLWNAAAALGVPVAELAAGADTVMVSLSKGLGCPVGACLAVRARERARAWELRKRLGGGMRQSGILAAAGLWALDHHVDRLPNDHAHARLFAEGLAGCPGVRVTPPESNIVMIELVAGRPDAAAAAAALERAGVRVVPFGKRRLRAVTHLDVSRANVTRAAAIAAEVLA
jgi:threonine aldolase